MKCMKAIGSFTGVKANDCPEHNKNVDIYAAASSAVVLSLLCALARV
jgi:hypothetical protein